MFFQILLFSIILLFLHELGHVISAKILGLKIKNISFLFKPYPHFFVAVSWPNNNKERMIYLFSGVFITLSLFAISICFNFFNLKALYIAFIIQIIIESNPFYSDYTIAIMSNDKKIKYTQITDIDIMKSKGIQSVPYLEVDGELKNFKESMEWIRNAN